MEEKDKDEAGGDAHAAEYGEIMYLIGNLTQWEVVLENNVEQLLAILVGDGRVVPILFRNSGTGRKLDIASEILKGVPQLFSSDRTRINDSIKDAQQLLQRRNTYVHNSISLTTVTDLLDNTTTSGIMLLDRKTYDHVEVSSASLYELACRFKDCAINMGKLAGEILEKCDPKDKPRYPGLWRKLNKKNK